MAGGHRPTLKDNTMDVSGGTARGYRPCKPLQLRILKFLCSLIRVFFLVTWRRRGGKFTGKILSHLCPRRVRVTK